MKKLIKDVTVITMNENNDILKNHNIIINGDTIEEITDKLPEGEFEVISPKGGIVIPALVNGHTHVSMTLLRSYADGYDLQDWLFNYIFPVEEILTDEDIYYGAMIGIMDMISSGCVLFADMYDHMEQVARAVAETGTKAMLCRGVTYFDDSVAFENHKGTCEAVSLCKNFNNTADGRIKTNLGPHSVYTTTERFLRHMTETAQNLGCGMHIHLSETVKENEDCIKEHGKSPTQYLSNIGFFDVPVIAAHCVHLSDDDIKILSDNNVTPVHNPTSNLKLGSGIAPIMKMKNLNLAIGTDGASSNNNLNMLEEIHLASLITNGAQMNPKAVSAYEALKWGTNARGIGFDDTGVIEAGKKADIVILDGTKPHCMPMHNPLSNVVYSMGSGDVDYVFSNGSLLYKKGEFLTIDKEKIYFETNKCFKRIFNK